MRTLPVVISSLTFIEGIRWNIQSVKMTDITDLDRIKIYNAPEITVLHRPI